MCSLREKKELPETLQTESGFHQAHEQAEQIFEKGSKKMKPQELTIDGELFEDFRNNFDVAMKLLINRMIKTRISKGTVTSRITINMKELIEDGGEVVRRPEIDFGISMSMSEKDSMKGNMRRGLILRQGPSYELLVGTDQISMDELMEVEK